MSEIRQLPSTAIGRERQVMVVTAGLAMLQFGAAYRALHLPENVSVSLLPPLEFIAAVAWGFILSAATWRVAWHKERNLRTGVEAMVAFVVYSVARLFVFTRADYDYNRLRFLLVVTILVLIAAVLYLMRPVVRRTESTPGAAALSGTNGEDL
ncbi:MAG: hypothetical protein ABI835_07925 [Chloroflexota bacterium]